MLRDRVQRIQPVIFRGNVHPVHEIFLYIREDDQVFNVFQGNVDRALECIHSVEFRKNVRCLAIESWEQDHGVDGVMISSYQCGADTLDQAIDKDARVRRSPVIDDVRCFTGLLLLPDIEVISFMGFTECCPEIDAVFESRTEFSGPEPFFLVFKGIIRQKVRIELLFCLVVAAVPKPS